MKRTFFRQLTSYALAVAFLPGAGLLLADEPQPVQATARARVVEEAKALLKQADDGTWDESLLERQQQLVDALRQLLTDSQGTPVPEKSSPGEAEASRPSGLNNSGTSVSPSTTAGPATPDAGSQQPRSVRPLADAIWGHLPARERDELYQSFSEQYLPQYDRALREYFRALAEMQGEGLINPPDKRPSSLDGSDGSNTLPETGVRERD